VNRYTKIEAELVVAPREVLEARPRSAPPPKKEDDRRREDEERWDNTPCTD
jgi:hypothetical protein